jgi:transposase
MSEEEVRRVGILARLESGELKQRQAAELLDLSQRQVKRLCARYRQEGASGLVHGNAGRRSNRAKPPKLRKKIIELIRKHYSGGPGERFGPTLAAEHLSEEYGLQVDSETLRRWMLAAGLWTRERKRKRYRQRRLRRAHFGELLQLDGSFHEWLEDRGPQGCLLNLVDDASGTAMACFAKDETTWAVADLLRAWVERYGIPRAIYTDWKSVYHAPPEKEEVAPQLSQFGHMCAQLGIQLIAANSPQAKGRVERHHGTHQDRLVKKMRRLSICDYTAANRYLVESYLPAHNARFALPPADPVDFHQPLRRGLDLDSVFCLEHRRTVGNDWVLRFQNRFLQLAPDQLAAGMVVKLQQHRDGTLHLWHNGRRLRWRAISKRPMPAVSDPSLRRRGVTIPPLTHPWKRERTLPVRADSTLLRQGKGAQSPPLALHPIPG